MSTRKELKQYVILDTIQIIIAGITFFVNFVLSYLSRGTSNEILFIGVAILSFIFVISGINDIRTQKKIYAKIIR